MPEIVFATLKKLESLSALIVWQMYCSDWVHKNGDTNQTGPQCDYKQFEAPLKFLLRIQERSDE